MSTIRVVGGTGEGPTAVASYDAALANAGVHNYNLSHVSSVIPASSTVEHVTSAPDLGPVGERLTVVEARSTVEDGETACAGLGWTLDEMAKGLFYEASGTNPRAVRETVEVGLDAGRSLRDWSFADEQIVLETVEPEAETGSDGEHTAAFATAVVLGIYGESESLL